MTSSGSLFWHDYETFGIDTRRDRPVQFAGIRTDLDFNPIGEPLMLYCKPARDCLPSPEACLVTGITPQKAMSEGLVEAEFMAAIHAEMIQAGTCSLGYNTLRFDDEVTRHGLYRNLYDAYEREWRNGNSRWDIIDMTRLTYALRPEGIVWPKDEQGRCSFRLERLTEANGISHVGAHDALSDVYATIELAKLIKLKQPKLYDYVWSHKGKREASALLNLGSMQPLLHVSEKYSADKGCIAVVVALGLHPGNQNGVIVYDLSVDPEGLLMLDSDEIAARLYTKTADLPDGVARIPLKTVHINKAPVLVPLKTMRPADAERLQIDLKRCEKNLEAIKGASGLALKLESVFSQTFAAEDNDVDLMLYGGGFFSETDKQKMAKIRTLRPQKLAELKPEFNDKRLAEMFFRYKARNWPEILSEEEQERWNSHRIKRLTVPGNGASIVWDEFRQKMTELQNSADLPADKLAILKELMLFGEELVA